MTVAATIADRILRALGGPFDRAARELAVQYVEKALGDQDEATRQRCAAYCDNKALLYPAGSEKHQALHGAAASLRAGQWA